MGWLAMARYGRSGSKPRPLRQHQDDGELLTVSEWLPMVEASAPVETGLVAADGEPIYRYPTSAVS